MKYYLIPLLIGTLSAFGADSDPALLLDIDFATAGENAQGTLIVPNSEAAQTSSGEAVTFTAKTTGGNAYTLDDVASEEGVAFLKFQPKQMSFLEVVLPESIAPGNDDFSVAFWYKPSSEEMIPGFLLLGGTTEPAWSVESTENGHIKVMFNGCARGDKGNTVGHGSNAPLIPGEWNHVAIVFDRNESILIYLNGVFDSESRPIYSQMEAMPGRVFLGGPHRFPSGDFGKFRMFRGKLSAQQVEQLAGDPKGNSASQEFNGDVINFN